MGKVELGKAISLGDKDCSAAILWLHGFGDTPGGWAQALQPFRTAVDAKWKWLHLCAPMLEQPCYGNRKLSGWGQFKSTERIRVGSADYNEAESYAASVNAVMAELEELEKKLPANRLVIGGFSQGAAVALECALRYPRALAGCIVLSGWATPQAREIAKKVPTPFLLCHGDSDDMVDVACGEAAAEMLRKADNQVDFRKYPGMKHESCPDLLTTLAQFVCKHLSQPLPEIDWTGSDSDSEDGVIYISKAKLDHLRGLEEPSVEELFNLNDLDDSEVLVPVMLQPEELLSMPAAEAIKVVADAVDRLRGSVPEITAKEFRDMGMETEQAEEEDLSDEEEVDVEAHGTSEPPEKKPRTGG